MNKPLVSVIVPTIGRPVLFARALGSVAAQAHANLEIFVSDNAADPRVSHEEVAAACGQRPFKLVRREKRLAFADHFNTCLREASGEYAMFLSDDDLLVPRFVETAVECIESGSDVGAVLSCQTKIDEHFNSPVGDPNLTSLTESSEDFYLRWFRDCRIDDILTFVSLFGRRDEMVKAGGFGNYPSGAHSDTELLLALTLGRSIGLVSGGFLYRVYAGSVGLGMPWPHLWEGTRDFETHLAQWRRQGPLSAELHRALLRSHSTMMISRYRSLYRRRASWANRVKPVLDIGGRLVVNLLCHGPAATPILQRFYQKKT